MVNDYLQSSAIKAEFHVHTRFSKDSFLTLHMLLFRCKMAGLNMVAITDHNCVIGALKAKELFRKYGITVIVGEEVMTNQGEIIGLFLTEKIESGLSPEETIQEILKQDGLVWIPHPYDEKRYKTVLDSAALKKNQQKIHCIEKHNGRNADQKYSEMQATIAKETQCIAVVGSDAHSFFELGRNYAIMPPFEDTETFLSAVRQARWETKPCIFGIHFYTKVVRTLRKLWRKLVHG